MKIEINDNARMRAGLDKVAEGKYFDALCLFARVDSYESMLNQIGCLVALHDNGYAVELYYRFLAKYYFTHNCYSDLNKIGYKVVELLAFFDKQLVSEEFFADKVSADVSLLGNFEEVADGFDDEEFFDEYEEYPTQSGWCDVRSTEYFFRKVQLIQDMTENGQFKKSHDIATELLEFESTDETVLEAQMLLCIAERKFDEGAKLAEKLALQDNVTSYRAIAIAVGLLSNREESRDLLEKMVKRLIDLADDIEGGDLLEYMELAEGVFASSDVLGKLAELTYARYKVLGCEALRSCARVFFNMGSQKTARSATLKLINALPWDSCASLLLRYIDSAIPTKLDKPITNLSLLRHADVPTQLGVIAQYQLIQRMQEALNNGGECILHTDDYTLLDCIVSVCKSHAYRGNSDKFVNDATVLSTILTTFSPENNEEFYDFAKRQLCAFTPEAPINKDILFRLIQLGCRDKLLVNVQRSYYILDLSQLTNVDEDFLDAFSLCAVLRKVDPRRLQYHFAKVAAAVDLKEFQSSCSSKYDYVHKLAYCLLALSYKSFAKSGLADYFGEGEEYLYLQYKSLTSK